MNDEEARFKLQDQFGRAYNEDEFIIFNVAIQYPETVVCSTKNVFNIFIQKIKKRYNLIS